MSGSREAGPPGLSRQSPFVRRRRQLAEAPHIKFSRFRVARLAEVGCVRTGKWRANSRPPPSILVSVFPFHRHTILLDCLSASAVGALSCCAIALLFCCSVALSLYCSIALRCSSRNRCLLAPPATSPASFFVGLEIHAPRICITLCLFSSASCATHEDVLLLRCNYPAKSFDDVLSRRLSLPPSRLASCHPPALPAPSLFSLASFSRLRRPRPSRRPSQVHGHFSDRRPQRAVSQPHEPGQLSPREWWPEA